ncbi:hypothetical protein HS088_TW20G00169 [Tripterygium wilfordii]|uniref:NAC domain-containing protein n=1 Tax=Tripterygium wilfordii TaxID=458696 RepID=A0A7J7C6P0_TRIWF|nr:protein NTM1-like 9 [Tripterygium wilfordii]KAF5729804.1 hypothetical protein HS088_TW20G00169 [Tripterygium wilfordii]
MAVLSIDRLPLGFRFRPSDEELINHYLRLKVNGRDSEVEVIREVDICKWEPWDLPGLSVIKTEDPEWFFFCPRDRKYPNGHRSNRATDAGYWKATGKDRTIKSGRPNQSLIGMKKTLVFYRGRAPKGQRTRWIMHEYRPTLKELDGTGPGQSAFVIFRLFRKPEENIESQKYDEVENNGLSPTTSKSSPDDMTSDLVEEAETSAMQEGKETEGAEKQFDQLNNMAPNTLVPVQSCSNSHMTSDGEDHPTVATPMNEYTMLNGNSDMYNPMDDQIDCKVFPPKQSQILAELTPPYMDSPYASDFGDDHNWLQFQNGSCEEDVSFSDLFDGSFTNNDECSGEESTSRKNSVVGSATQLPGHECVLQTIPPEYSNNHDNDIYNHTNAEMSSLQHDPGMGTPRSYNELLDSKELLQIPASLVSWPLLGEESRNNVGDLGNISVGQDASSAYLAMGSFYDICNNVDRSIWQNNPLEYGSNGSGTGIKIINRQLRQQPNPNNFANQGTAPRRIRLQIKNSLGSVGNGEGNNSIYFANEDEPLPSSTEASKTTKQTAMPEKSVDGKTIDVGDPRNKIRTHRTRRLRRRRNTESKTNNSSSETVGNGKIGDATSGDGVQSAVTEATEAAVPGPTFKPENETQLPKIKSSYKETTDELSGKLRLRASQYDDYGSRQIESPSITKAPSPTLHSQIYSKVYSASIFLVVAISMVSIGVWMYGR